ncbi:MAG: DUF262 domain-containing protein [Spirochaetes bacterium]|uniref:DUF262 domain-containing protein n=1 Tax=Candidatus Gallitreponema excrementavium TaxID=2840840 RepID=A0A9D9HP74_9SPIR|nr:DUF262 domain-containing protein [Candidatus Gallitreponema excrementavium]
MSQTTFWNLLKENKIEIPIIQRDYAQGREGKEYLRQTFLESLKQALDENKVLKLDFVYGSTENGVLQPLDGQQRLTTLWLLHWYMAMRAGKLYEAGETLKKFTYETRISSREFCEELCNASNFDSYVKYCIGCKPLDKCPRKSIVDFITSQTWFYSSWKQDPTIQSMLRMLGGTQIKGKSGNDIPDGIEEVFGESSDFKKYWDKLESDNAPIVFYYLPLKDFGLSDDLYIKMNARGKQLTNFENFKADLVGYIKKKAEEENEKWKNLASSVNGIPAKLDMEWTDIFWQNKTDDGRIDEIYFAFLNRYFLYSLLQRDDSAENLQEDKIFIYLYGSNGNDTDLQYTSKAFEFDKFPELHSSLESLEKTLDNLYKSLSDENSKISSEKFSAIKEAVKAPWKKDPDDNSFCFIPEYKSNIITNLTQSHRVVFFAVCKYFENKKYKEQSFKRWMRIVWNIVENSNVNNISSMQGCMKLIKELAEESFENREDNGNEDYCIYELLCTLEDGFVEKSFVKEQLKEEIAKAKQILDGDQLRKYKDNKTWEDVIIEAENYAFFKGAIRFLFRNENGEWDWKDFDTKWGNAKKIFNDGGLSEEYADEAKANRIILSYCNNWVKQIESYSHHDKYIFSCTSKVWKDNILLKNMDNSPLYGYPVHQLLMGEEINNELYLKVKDGDLYRKDNDEYRWEAFRKLVNTTIISWVQNKKNSDKWYVRWVYEGFSLYPSSMGVILTLTTRDDVLSALNDEGKIKVLEEVIETKPKMLFGWDIHFEYKKNKPYSFRWQHWNWIDMYKGDKRLVDDEKYKDLKIDGESITDKNSLIQSLNACIEKYEKLQSEQPTS